MIRLPRAFVEQGELIASESGLRWRSDSIALSGARGQKISRPFMISARSSGPWFPSAIVCSR